MILFLCTTSRCGAHWFGDMLRLSGIGQAGEYFHDDELLNLNGVAETTLRREWGLEGAPYPVYFKRLVEEKSAGGVFVCMTGIGQLTRAKKRLGATWGTHRKKFILMHRAGDIWRQAISLYRARESGSWRHDMPGRFAPFNRHEITRLKNHLEDCNRRWLLWFEKHIAPEVRPVYSSYHAVGAVDTIDYGSAVEQPFAVVNMVCQFLGIDPVYTAHYDEDGGQFYYTFQDGTPAPVSDMKIQRDALTEHWLRLLEIQPCQNASQ